MDGAHNLVQLRIDFGCRPRDMHRVLRHFQTGSSYAAGIDCLARCEKHLVFDEQIDSFSRAAHVGDFGHASRLVLNQLTGIVGIQLVLRRAWQGDIDFLLPRFLAGIERSAGEFLDIRLDDVVARSTQFQHIVYLLAGNAVRVVNVSVGSGDGNYLCAQLRSLQCRTPSHVAEAGDSHRLSFNINPVFFQHLVNEIQRAETRCLRTED